MYKLIAGLSVLIRLFVLPNPFESFQYGVLINFAIEPVLHVITFGIVGLFYSRSSAPAIGSFLYLLFYCINIGLLQLWALLGATIFIGVVIVGGYIAGLTWIIDRRNKIGW